MKILKYVIIAAILVSGLSSCIVDRPGYYRPHHHHYHRGPGYYR